MTTQKNSDASLIANAVMEKLQSQLPSYIDLKDPETKERFLEYLGKERSFTAKDKTNVVLNHEVQVKNIQESTTEAEINRMITADS